MYLHSDFLCLDRDYDPALFEDAFPIDDRTRLASLRSINTHNSFAVRIYSQTETMEA